LNLYFGEPDNPAQLRRWLAAGRWWLEADDVYGAALPDPHSPQDIVAAIEVAWDDGGWHGFARGRRELEGETIICSPA
jgi:hypothetical protein